MSTQKQEIKEWQNFNEGNLSYNNTRGLVVSNRDPLFAGRVKVYIPAVHGAPPYDLNSTIQDKLSAGSLGITGISSSGAYLNPTTVDALPWAKVLSHNLGPTIDLQTNASTSAGCFTTPSVGAEVIIMFENGDPTLPIVVGSIIHAGEFRYSLSRPLEYLPGLQVAAPKQIESTADPAVATPGESASYETDVARSYVLKTASGSTLFISDDPLNRAIVLEGTIKYGISSVLTEPEVTRLSDIYPAFPTTASAAFSKRQLLAPGTTSALVAPIDDLSVPGTTAPAATGVKEDASQLEANKKLIDEETAKRDAQANYEKSWPVSGTVTWPNGQPHGPDPYGAPRPGRVNNLHTGIYIGTQPNGGTALVAPIDCFPLFQGTMQGAGNALMVLGIDGYGHAFFHLESVAEDIKKLCNGTTALIKRGTPLGKCGSTGKSIGTHLHWEVFYGGDAKTGVALRMTRDIAAEKPNNSGMVDPTNGWAKTPKTTLLVDGKDSMVFDDVEQARQYLDSQHTLAINNEWAGGSFDKPAGLEISLTPGKETVTLRHPSGSFIGFDPDGNILIYSSGDVNFRVNRSITYDVLGAILESAYAKFTSVKSVMRRWGTCIDAKRAKFPNTDMPEFFTRADAMRNIDKKNALASSVGNSYLVDPEGFPIDPNDPLSPKNSSDNAGVSPLPAGSTSLNDLQPAVKKKAEDFIAKCKAKNIEILITSTLRTNAIQDALYARGRTAPGKIVTNAKGGQSFHNYGAAFDFVPLINSAPAWNDAALFEKCGIIGEGCGLEWAGRWSSFKEMAHFQYTGGFSLRDFQKGDTRTKNLT